jgi:hypothetical protein
LLEAALRAFFWGLGVGFSPFFAIGLVNVGDDAMLYEITEGPVFPVGKRFHKGFELW